MGHRQVMLGGRETVGRNLEKDGEGNTVSKAKRSWLILPLGEQTMRVLDMMLFRRPHLPISRENGNENHLFLLLPPSLPFIPSFVSAAAATCGDPPHFRKSSPGGRVQNSPTLNVATYFFATKHDCTK